MLGFKLQIINRIRKNLLKLTTRSFSQLNQEIWVLSMLDFEKSKPLRGKGRFFVDVGAGDPVKFSNTFLLEKKYSWKGILIDADPRRVSKLKQVRTNLVLNYAISEFESEKIMLAKDPDFTVSNRVSHKLKHKLFEPTGEVVEIKGKKLNDVLKEYNCPVNFDYLTIDVEGMELNVLQTLDLNYWKPKLITIEHNYREDREKIRKHIESFGYIKSSKESFWDDWYYLHSSFKI